MQHIQQAVSLYRELTNYFDAHLEQRQSEKFANTVNAKFAILLQYLNSQFPKPRTHNGGIDDPKEIQQMDELFTNFSSTQQYENLPPTLLETLIPLAIVRNFISSIGRYNGSIDPKFQIKVDGKFITPWEQFGNKYSYLILKFFR